jgi:hypothetical protein
MEEKRRGRISFVGLPLQPMRSMLLERHVILCVKSSLCCPSVSIFANHAADIVPEARKDYYPPTTPRYKFEDPFDLEFSQIGKALKPGSRGSVNSVASMVVDHRWWWICVAAREHKQPETKVTSMFLALFVEKPTPLNQTLAGFSALNVAKVDLIEPSEKGRRI